MTKLAPMINKLADAKKQARAQLASIRELVAALDTQDDHAADEARDRIHEDALSVEVRSGWVGCINVNTDPEEFRILLCTGGPAVQIRGSLTEHFEPNTDSICLQCQDWFQPWTDVKISEQDRAALATYCSCFYFGG